MLKAKPPDCSPAGNVKKYLSYREAWARIKESQQQEFYLEAVTLTESIISDRLTSYLTGAKLIKSNPKPGKNLSFSDLIKRWKKKGASSVADSSELSNLQNAVDSWRLSRNEIVHRMVRSHPDLQIDDVESFLEKAKDAAATGEKLARAVDKWCKQAKKEAKSTIKK